MFAALAQHAPCRTRHLPALSLAGVRTKHMRGGQEFRGGGQGADKRQIALFAPVLHSRRGGQDFCPSLPKSL